MARVDLSDRILSRDQKAFLLGTLVVMAAEASRRRKMPGFSVWRLIRISREARADVEHSVQSIAAAIGFPVKDLQYELDRFEPSFKAESRRHLVGERILAARTLAGGLAAAQRLLWAFRKPGSRASAIAERLRPLSRRTGVPREADDRVSVWDEMDHVLDLPELDNDLYSGVEDERPAPGEASPHGLEAWGDAVDISWHDDIATEPGLETTPSVPDYLIDDDVEAETRPRPTARLERWTRDRADISEWLVGLGAANSGVNIDPLADRIVERLTDDEARQIAASIGKPGSDRARLRSMREALRSRELPSNEQLYLRRLGAVFDLIGDGYRLPVRRELPDYLPEEGKIFYILHMRDPFEVNGYVSRSHLLMSSIVSAGYEPIAITRLGFPQDLHRHRNARIDDVDEMEGRPVFALPDPGNGQMGRPLDDYIDAYAERIATLARQHRPALLHAASNHLNALAAIKAARQLGIPCVYEVRGIWEITQASSNETYASTLRYELQRTLENASVRAADRVVTISEPLRHFVIGHGAREDHVSVVPNGVDSEQITPQPRDSEVLRELGIDPGKTVIGYVGSIVRYEGLDYLIHAVRRLHDKGVKRFHLLVVGDGKELPALRQLATTLGVSDLCTFTGRIPRDQVPRLYSAIDIVPLPRRSLPVTELVPPLKPFEAMAAGKAVIVSSVQAIAGTVIHEKTGLIVEKDNVGDLADALERLILDDGMRTRMGEVAREWVEQERSVPALARRIAAVYESLGVQAAV